MSRLIWVQTVCKCYQQMTSHRLIVKLGIFLLIYQKMVNSVDPVKMALSEAS